jgi:hypothetical protein
MTLKNRHLLALLAIVSVLALLPSPAAASTTVSVVASGLDSPRGIAFYKGHLLVGEAGHGGSTCFPIPGLPFPACVGNTSQISWVNASNGSHTPLVSGLFSVSLGPEGVLGVSGLSVAEGKILAQIGSTPQEGPPTFTLGQQQAGRLIKVKANGTWTVVASVGATDFQYTTRFTPPNPAVCGQCPGTQEHDANPYGVLATEQGAYVADAGANTLDFVSANGKISILHRFGWRDPNPMNFPSDAVPDCVARGDDALWVGELSGQLFKVHGRHVTQVILKDAAGNPLLTHVTGCTSDRNGNLYFVNMFGPGIPFTSPSFFQGNVIQYNPEEGKASVLAGNLMFPNMAAVGPDGNLYVTAGAICPAVGANVAPCFGATGTVLKIALPRNEEGD